jgi:hypothetical protein
VAEKGGEARLGAETTAHASSARQKWRLTVKSISGAAERQQFALLN